MRYELREGLFAPGPPAEIVNRHGWAPMVAVPGDPWREALVLRDRAGLERVTLRLLRTPAGALAALTRAGRPLAMVVPGGLLRAPALRLEGGAEARACGDVAGGAYRIALGGAVLAEVTRAGEGPVGRLVVELAEGQNEPLLLAACVAIDALARREGRRTRGRLLRWALR